MSTARAIYWFGVVCADVVFSMGQADWFWSSFRWSTRTEEWLVGTGCFAAVLLAAATAGLGFRALKSTRFWAACAKACASASDKFWKTAEASFNVSLRGLLRTVVLLPVIGFVAWAAWALCSLTVREILIVILVVLLFSPQLASRNVPSGR